jgi:hypothetical protein
VDAAQLIEELLRLGGGEHIHLDEVIDDCPPPGSPAWLPVLAEVGQVLRIAPGHWYISFPIGEVGAADASAATLDEIHSSVSEVATEPPAVYRAPQSAVDTWEGQKITQISSRQGVRTTTSLSRTWAESDAGEPWYATVTMEVITPFGA